MFENSIQLVEQCELTWLHVFPYSPRPDTPAARMPQLDGPTIKARAAALRQAGDAQRQRWLEARLGQTLSVLVEKQGETRSEGRSGNFARVQLPSQYRAGELVSLRVSGHDGLMLSGDVL
jgi:threonylcarbamoyladenosine tRNA methylthiotransferase MtaB